MIKVKVPATSANLGSGFDVLGLALDLYNSFCFEDSQDFGPDDLPMTTYKWTFNKFGQSPQAVRISQEAHIPRAGGLGSSSSCIVAAIVAAMTKMGMEIDRKLVLKLATELEGHPDNVAPAIYGGLVASTVASQVHYIKYGVDPDLRFFMIVPDFSIETTMARDILPKQIALADGIANLSSIVFLIEGLQAGNMDYIRLGVKDKLHQDYRKSLIAGYDDLRELVQGQGQAFYLSGAGSTMMAITDKADKTARLIEDFLKNNYPSYQLMEARVNNDGFQIIDED